MNRLLSIIFIAGLVFLVGCQIETKYQCADGEVVNSIDLCSTQSCPDCLELTETEIEYVVQYQCYDGTLKETFSDCEAPEKIIEYQCRDGTVKSDVKNCDIIQVNEEDSIAQEQSYDYKYSSYYDYEKEVLMQLENEVDAKVVGGYGSYERKDGKIYMIMHDEGGDFNENYRFWAVEINGETGDLIRYKEIENDGCPGQAGKCPDESELWW